MDLKEKKFALFLIGLFAVAAVFIFGCKPREIITSDRQLKDSTVTKSWVEFRDTVILIEADSAAIMAMVPGCPDLPEQVTQNGRVRVSAKVKDGQLTVDCKCKELEKRLQLMIGHMIVDRFRDERRHDTQVIYQKYIPGWVKFFAWTGGAYLLLTLVWAGYKLVKLYIKVKPI